MLATRPLGVSAEGSVICPAHGFYRVTLTAPGLTVSDAVDGSRHRHRDVPNCGANCSAANVRCWLRLLKNSFEGQYSRHSRRQRKLNCNEINSLGIYRFRKSDNSGLKIDFLGVLQQPRLQADIRRATSQRPLSARKLTLKPWNSEDRLSMSGSRDKADADRLTL